MKKRGAVIRCVRLAGILFCLTVTLQGYARQNSPTSGALAGVVRDVSGSVIRAATVIARSLNTNQTRRASSTEDGSYRFVALPGGDYEIRVEVSGFAPYVNSNVTIPLGRVVLLDVSLKLAGVSQDVAVTDQPPPLDPTATATTTTIDPERTEELPVNSRNYLEFALLAPGVAPSNSQSSTRTQGQSGSPVLRKKCVPALTTRASTS